MYYLELPQSDKQRLSFYLATEEYAARYLSQSPIFFYWQVEPSVIIGRNQCLDNEINANYCREHDIKIYRRKSGGGCVYADMGNIMLAYIADGENVGLTYSNYVHLVISALKKMGIEAQTNGRNDISVEGRKVSGTAFYHLHGRNIVHGTLLYDTNMQNMLESITPPREKLAAKGVKSVRSRIGLLKDYTSLTLCEIKHNLRESMCNNTIKLSADDISKISEIEKTYLSDEFIYDSDKRWDVVRKARIENCGMIEVKFRLSQGNITAVKFSGDFFTIGDDYNSLQEAMCGVKYEEQTLRNVFKKFSPAAFIRGLSAESLLKLMFI